MRSPDTSPNTSNINRRSRRMRAAALVVELTNLPATFLGIGGAAAAAEAATAMPARAGTEAAHTLEAKTSAQYVAELRKDMLGVYNEARKAKGHWGRNSDYALLAPDSQNPQLHDMLLVGVGPDSGATIMLIPGMDTNKEGQYLDPEITATGGTMVATSSAGGEIDTVVLGRGLPPHETGFGVSTNPNIGKTGVNYSKEPAVVESEMKAFLEEVQHVVDKHYANPMPILKQIALRKQRS